MTDEQGMVYITIPGDEPCELTFRVYGGDCKSPSTDILEAGTSINYETDAVIGSPRAPFVIDLAQATGIAQVAADGFPSTVYDLQGRKVAMDDNSRRLSKGVYIVNGQKKTVK